MKSQRIFLAIITIFASFLICFGQEKPKAELFDELSNLFCTEDNRARMDNFLLQIRNNPGAKGYVIGYADSAIPGRFLKYFNTLQIHVRFRQAPVERFIFLRGANRDKMLFQFWIVPDKAEPPKPESSFSFEKISLPALFDKSRIASISKNKVAFGSQGEEPCDWGLRLKDFADVLKSDSNLIGQLTAYSDNEKGKEFAEKSLKLTLQQLMSEFKIPRRRLQINYGGMREEREIELWIVPKGETK